MKNFMIVVVLTVAIGAMAPAEQIEGATPGSGVVTLLASGGEGAFVAAAPTTLDLSATPAPVSDPARASAATNAGPGTVESESQTLSVPPLTKPVEAEKELISVAVDDVSLQEVVKMFTRVSGANIIATPTNLQGRVTVNLQDVEWKPALSSILDMYNLSINEKSPGSGIYSVTPKPPGAAEPLVAETILLNYAAVSNVAAMVQPLLGKEGSISQFPNGNALVVRSTAANVGEIRKIVKNIDLPRQQVFIEAKFLQLSEDAIKDLGIDWSMLQGYSIGMTPGWSYDQEVDSTKTKDDSLKQTDARTHNDTLKQWYNETPPGSGNYVATPVVPSPDRNVSDIIGQGLTVNHNLQNTLTKTITDVRTATLNADQLKIVLSALKQQNGVNIVSNPKIIVANEQTATIHIGANVPNIRGTVTAGQQGQANTTTYALDDKKPYFELGLSIDVTPTINNSSNITVRIVPTLSDSTDNKTAPDGNTYPIENITTINTVFSLESGKTAAIGGLTKISDQDKTSKIPLLGDIPLLGKYLFSHTHKDRLQQETIIFVTVCLANPQTIEKTQGLPEDAALVQRQLAADMAARARKGDSRNAAVKAALHDVAPDVP